MRAFFLLVCLAVVIAEDRDGFTRPTKETHWNRYGMFPRGAFSPRSGDAPHWGYSGSIAPAHWASLSSLYSDCAGSAQSPINIPLDIASTFSTEVQDASNQLSPLVMYHTGASGTIANNGHSIVFSYDDETTNTLTGSYLTGTYMLLQFHFHHHSEHARDGLLPFEMHLVHQHPTTHAYAVVAILFEVGAADPFVARIVEEAENLRHEGNATAKTLNVGDVVPTDKSYFQYMGSFTTPPCTEGVNWFVLKETKTISQSQVDALSVLWGTINNRPVQQLNSRTLRYFDAPTAKTYLHVPPASTQSHCAGATTVNINFAGMFSGTGWAPPTAATGGGH